MGFTINNLIEAIRAGHVSGVVKALDDGDDIELPDMHGYRGLPLRTACFEGNPAVVHELLKRGANPNADANDGPGAPLRLALRMKHEDVVALLLENGATVPEGVVLTPELTDIPYDTQPASTEAIVAPGPEIKPDNMIEFFSPSLPLPDDDTEAPAHFGTETSLLSMDLLFLEENDTPPPPVTGKR